MKSLFVFILSLSALCSLSSFAGDGGLASDSEPKLSEHTGVYRGFGPTDDSALKIGEIEMTISNDKVSVRMATGSEIQSIELPVDDFRPMTRAEVESFYPTSTEFTARSFGFKDVSGYPQFLFLRNPSVDQALPARSEFGLVVKTGSMLDALGPTVLLAPSQLEKVSCEQYLGSIEFGITGQNGVIPRLDTEGRTPKKQ